MKNFYTGEGNLAVLPPENGPEVDISIGDQVISKSGTIRIIKDVNYDRETFLVLRKSTDGKVSEEGLSFEQLNQGKQGISSILHTSGQRDFLSSEAELDFLVKQKAEEEKDFKNGSVRLHWSSMEEAEKREKRIEELKGKIIN